MNSASHINLIYVTFCIQDIQAPQFYVPDPHLCSKPRRPTTLFVLTPFTPGVGDRLCRRGRRLPGRITRAVQMS